jgi:hypothetical protein
MIKSQGNGWKQAQEAVRRNARLIAEQNSWNRYFESYGQDWGLNNSIEPFNKSPIDDYLKNDLLPLPKKD